MDEQANAPSHTFSPLRFGQELLLIGEGQHASVCEGFDFDLQRRVALKLSRLDVRAVEVTEDIDDQELCETMRKAIRNAEGDPIKSKYTLMREARLIAKVQHPAVVQVLEFGQFEGGSGMVVVMPLLDGAPLPCSAPWRAHLDRMLHFAGGLAATHEAKIVHRDLKPANVFYDHDGWPYIGDFGLACELSDEAAMKQFVGSRKWMAPEVLDLEKGSGVANDIFAFFMIVFEWLHGYPPFVDEDAKAEGRISDIRRDDMPDTLREVLAKGLVPDPEARWSSMREVIAALEAVRRQPDQTRIVEFEQQLAIRDARIAELEQAAPRVKQRPKRRWLGAAAAAGLALGLGVGVSLPEAKADSCDEVSRELVDFWNHDVQVELRVVLGTRKASDYLEGFASRWVAVRAQECDAAKREGGADRASPCTTSVRSHLNATISALRTPHERQGLDFEKLLGGLPAPEHCLEHPEDAEYGVGGMFELQMLDIEIMAGLAGGDLEAAERRQAHFMLAARELSSLYHIARAIFWRAELHRLRGEFDEAEADFKRAYTEARELGAVELEGDSMMMLASLAGARGDLAALEDWAFVARNVFGRRRPDKVAELLQVQGLALVEGDPTQRERGIGLLRDAVAMREAQHSHYGGSREKVGWALEALARGLLAAEQADEALELAKETLAVHELEFGSTTKRAHELRRLLFVTQVDTDRFDDAYATEERLFHAHVDAHDWSAYVDEALWTSSVYSDADMVSHALYVLKRARQVSSTHGRTDLTHVIDVRLLEVNPEPPNSP